ncbi:MAG: pyruvate kinase [Alkalispirochaetaceae bacterium]
MVYDVIATLGPASSTADSWWALLEAGASRFRLNTSHLSPDGVERWVESLRRELGMRCPPIVLDLQGSKWRLGELAARQLHRGERVVLGMGAKAELPVPHEDFFEAARASSGVVRLNDAKVELRIESAEADRVQCQVVRGGPVSKRKGISLPGSSYRREGLLPRDEEIVRRTRGQPELSYALSYVRDREEMTKLAAALPDRASAIAKIERPESLHAAREISREAGEVWLCRGDLGAEIGGVQMAREVNRFASMVRELSGPAILAGQVLEHMTRSEEPTRSELCHLYDSLLAGFSGVVLSDETAVGSYPAESCRAAASFR